jgi:hypothetical protein
MFKKLFRRNQTYYYCCRYSVILEVGANDPEMSIVNTSIFGRQEYKMEKNFKFHVSSHRKKCHTLTGWVVSHDTRRNFKNLVSELESSVISDVSIVHGVSPGYIKIEEIEEVTKRFYKSTTKFLSRSPSFVSFKS